VLDFSLGLGDFHVIGREDRNENIYSHEYVRDDNWDAWSQLLGVSEQVSN